MADPINSVRVGILYDDGSTRSYNFTGVADSVLADVATKIKAINAAPSSPFFDTFVSNSGANALRISSGSITSETQEVIYEG